MSFAQVSIPSLECACGADALHQELAQCRHPEHRSGALCHRLRADSDSGVHMHLFSTKHVSQKVILTLRWPAIFATVGSRPVHARRSIKPSPRHAPSITWHHIACTAHVAHPKCIHQTLCHTHMSSSKCCVSLPFMHDVACVALCSIMHATHTAGAPHAVNSPMLLRLFLSTTRSVAWTSTRHSPVLRRMFSSDKIVC